MSVESLLGTDAVFADDLQGLRPHPGQAVSAANIRAVLHGSGIMASHQTPECTRVQDAYSLRCAPQVHGAARDTVAHATDRRGARAGRRDRQPGDHRRRPRRVQRQLPRRPGRLRARLPGDRRRGRREHVRAPHRPVPRRRAQQRPAPVPGARPRGRLRPDDRAVHGRRAGLGAQAAGGPGERRLDPVVGHAGGPRVDGLARGPQAAARHRRPDPGARHRDPHGRARDGPARAPDTVAGHRGRPRPAARAAAIPGPGPDTYLSPDLETAADAVRDGTIAAVLHRSTPHDRRPPPRPRPARHHAHRPQLADRGAAAHAHEQPRPRGRRAARRPGRLRRHRQGGAVVGRVRRDRADADHAGRRRDAAGPVGQAGRRADDARVGAARADRQLEPRRRLGDLAGVPPARAARADDVRADDGRLVDLHRHAGDPAGHLRDAGRGRREAVRRDARRHADRDRRLRRHGRRAAARRHAQRGRVPDRRRRRRPPAPPGPRALPGPGGDEPRRGDRAGHAGAAPRSARCPSASSATAAEVLPELLRRGVEVDVVTDQTSAHDPLSYLPVGVDVADWASYAAAKPEEFTDRARESMARHVEAMVGFHGRGRRGVRLRQLDPRRGPPGRLRPGVRLPRVRARVHPAAVRGGQGPVPLGRALGRPARHRGDRPGRARPVPRRRPPAPLDPRRAGPGRVPGAARADLLARARRARPRGAAVQRARRVRRGAARRSSSAATTSTPARSRRRTGRPRAWPTGPTPSPTGRC